MDEVDYNVSTGILNDKTPNQNQGTNSGAIFTEDRFGKTGGAMSFDGSGTIDGVTYGDNIVLPESVTDTRNCLNGCTYSIWLRVDEDAVDRMSLFRGHSTIRHIEIYSNTKKFRTEAGRQNGYSFGTGNFPDDVRGVWSHFVIVFAENEPDRPVYWYQNGQLFHEGNMTSGTYPDTEYFSFGSIGRSTGNTTYKYAKSFDGQIDDVRIYNRALSQEEIQSLYDSYEPKTISSSLQKGLVLDMPLKLKYTKDETTGSEIMTDRTPYSNDGKNNGAAITSDGASLDGLNDFIDLGSDILISPALQGWTASYWFNTNSASTLQHFNSADDDEFNANWLALYNSKLAVWNRSPGYWRYGSTIISSNKWYHAVFISDPGGTNYRFYINGVREGGDHVNNVWSSEYSALKTRYIGRYAYQGGFSRYFDGEIANTKIYNRALSDTEVKTLYDRGRSDAGIIFQDN